MAILAMNITGRMPVPRLVGAGLALPYIMRKMFAKKTRNYGIAMQTSTPEVCARIAKGELSAAPTGDWRGTFVGRKA
jgi:hypothetical protein